MARRVLAAWCYAEYCCCCDATIDRSCCGVSEWDGRNAGQKGAAWLCARSGRMLLC